MPKINNVFVDGGCVNNGKPYARAGCVYTFVIACSLVFFVIAHIIISHFAHRYSLHFDHLSNVVGTFVSGSQTNNRAVMSGLVEALKVRLLVDLCLSSNSL